MPITSFTPGTVVSARNRLWRVDQQEGKVLTATPLDGSQNRTRRFYLPVEPVERGELERPNQSVVGTIQAQDLLLRAHRLSMLHGTAPLLSLQRSRVIPKNYQLVPVAMALEMQQRVRMLIADDVGLGKTIEAGLIITELMARQQASRVLIVVPASLREQWKEALTYFFHLPARIISTRHRRTMERELPAGVSPWEQFPVLITSIDYAKQPAIKNQILEQSWDVALFDEAHLAAKPHASRSDTQATTERWEFARAIAESPDIRHLLLLTATPHNGYTDTFASLLRLLDENLVGGTLHNPSIRRSVAQRHVCQRRRQDVQEWFGEAGETSPFPDRDQEEVIIPPTQYERAAIDAVEAYGEQILASAEHGGAHSKTLANWTVLHLHKRALSSPAALRASLANRKKSLTQRAKEELGVEVAISESEAKATVLDEDTGERLNDEEAAERTERTVFGDLEAIRNELTHLESAIAEADTVTPSRDSKLRELTRTVLPNRLRDDPKVIVFTRYTDTMDYLAKEIASSKRLGDTEVFTIYGQLSETKRREVFQQFDAADKAVLVATDAISEGINLQHAAGQVIHYELPWNPNRLEQRNGRVDRFGQRRDTVYIRTMVMDETLDASIMKVLVRKAAKIRADYGFSPPYFGEDTDIMELLAQHEISLGPKQLTLFGDGEAASGDGPLAEAPEDPFSTDTLDRIKGDSFYGQTHVQLPDIEERLQRTERTIGSPEQIEHFVRSGLSRFGCQVKERADGTLRISITDPALRVESVGRVIEHATFDPEQGLDAPDITVLDLGHPLVRQLIDVVKQDAFEENTDHYGRTAYRVTESAPEVTVVAHLLARYATATDTNAPTAVLEELVPVGIPVYGETPLDPDTVQKLIDSGPTPQARSDSEVKEVLDDLDTFHPDADTYFEDALEQRRQALIDERAAMHDELSDDPDAPATAWASSLTDIAPGHFDVLTFTVYFPA